MFSRRFERRKNGKPHTNWALCESYRTERGPWQWVVAWLVNLDEQERLGVQRAAENRSLNSQQRVKPLASI